MVVVLPTFKGYTIDFRLREFRKVEYPSSIEFVPFDTPKSQKLLKELVKTGVYPLFRDAIP